MLRFLTTAATVLALLVTGAQASEDAACVQQSLSAWGYYSGSIDGVLGKKSAAAAASLAADLGLTLQPLATGTAKDWCVALAAAPPPAISLETLPYPKEPFFSGGSYDVAESGALAAEVDTTMCARGLTRFPTVEEPASHVSWVHGGQSRPTGTTFGIALGAYWPAIAVGIPEASTRAKDLLLKWARADALQTYEEETSGFWWATYTLLPTAIATFAELDRLKMLSADERKTIVSWFERLISDVHIGQELKKGTAGHKDTQQRINNHNTRRNLVAAIWAVMTDDVDMFNGAIKNGYLRFLENIRPDGSLDDANRGKWAMRYTSFNISSAMFIAEIASHQGLDLFSLKRNGQSIHTAIKFLLDSADDPSLINKYAKANVGMAGMSFNGKQDPSWREYLSDSTPIGWMEAYIARFPGTENSIRMLPLVKTYKESQQIIATDLSFGNVSCIYGKRATPPAVAPLSPPASTAFDGNVCQFFVDRILLEEGNKEQRIATGQFEILGGHLKFSMSRWTTKGDHGSFDWADLRITNDRHIVGTWEVYPRFPDANDPQSVAAITTLTPDAKALDEDLNGAIVFPIRPWVSGRLIVDSCKKP